MNNPETVIDPLGNEVLLPAYLSDLTALGVDLQDTYDTPAKVIEAPAMMLQVSGNADENYYYRSVSWENSLLIGTKKVEGRWTAQSILMNPSSQHLSEIYKKGNVVHLIDCNSF